MIGYIRLDYFYKWKPSSFLPLSVSLLVSRVKKNNSGRWRKAQLQSLTTQSTSDWTAKFRLTQKYYHEFTIAVLAAVESGVSLWCPVHCKCAASASFAVFTYVSLFRFLCSKMQARHTLNALSPFLTQLILVSDRISASTGVLCRAF